MDLSHLRLKMRYLARERLRMENRLLMHERLARGCLVRVRTRCGQPNCRCKKSDKYRHGPHLYLSVNVDGKTRMIHVPKAWVAQTEGWVKSAQSYRKTRKEWLKIQKNLWKVFMQMEQLKTQELPYGP